MIGKRKLLEDCHKDETEHRHTPDCVRSAAYAQARAPARLPLTAKGGAGRFLLSFTERAADAVDRFSVTILRCTRYLFSAAALFMLLGVGRSVLALGLGEITVESRLNEPLRAEIALLSATPQDVDSIRVGLASIEEFKRVGVPRLPLVGSLRFGILREGEKPPEAIVVTSREPVREPILSFLVEVASRSARMVREYAVLLDPAYYPASGLAANTGLRERRPIQPPAMRRYGPVQPGDSISELGFRLRPDSDVAGAQMATALYEANPDAFLNNDINQLMVGAYLNVPSKDRVLRIPYEKALLRLHGGKEESATAESGKALVRGMEQRPEEPLGIRAKTRAPVQPAKQVPASRPEYELRLISGEEEEELAGAAPLSGTSSKQPAERQPAVIGQALRQDSRPRDTQSENLSLRVKEIERRIADIEVATAMHERGAKEEEDQSPGDPQAVSTDASRDERWHAMEKTVADLQAQLSRRDAKIRELEAALSRSPQAEDEPSSGLRGTARLVLEGLLFLGTAGLLGWMLSIRARSTRERTVPDLELPGDSLKAPSGAVAESADGAPAEAALERVDPKLEQPDRTGLPDSERRPPASEAELYLAYGQLDQAERLLLDLVESHPDEVDYRTRLLRVLHSARKRSAFLEHAKELKRMLGDTENEIWAEVLELGNDLCPGEEVFASGRSQQGEPPVGEAAPGDRATAAFEDAEKQAPEREDRDEADKLSLDFNLDLAGREDDSKRDLKETGGEREPGPSENSNR